MTDPTRIPVAQPFVPVQRQTPLDDKAATYLDAARRSSQLSGGGPLSETDAAKLTNLASQLSAAEKLAIREDEATALRDRLTPIAQNPADSRSSAAAGLLRVLDAGIIPGVPQNLRPMVPEASAQGVFIDSGAPATREQVERARTGPAAAGRYVDSFR